MKKPDIKKLKYPLWFKIAFYILTIVIPIVGIVIQGFKSGNTTFKITFTAICALLLLWVFVRKFILNKLEDKLIQHKTALEHDYEIEVGNPDKERWLWFNNEMILTIINVIQVVLVGGLILLMAAGIELGALKIKGVSFLITILYVIAYCMKFITILSLRGKEQEESEVKDEGKELK